MQRLEAAPGVESQLTELMRDYTTLQDAYQSLLGKSQDAKVAANLERRQIGEQFKMHRQRRACRSGRQSPNRLRVQSDGRACGGLARWARLCRVCSSIATRSLRTDDDVLVGAVAAGPGDGADDDDTESSGKRRKRHRLLLASSGAVALCVVYRGDRVEVPVPQRVDVVMYEAFYGFRERPFDLTPNPRFLLLTGKHREALSNLQYGLTSRRGLTLLVGEAGTGKTTLDPGGHPGVREAGRDHRVPEQPDADADRVLRVPDAGASTSSPEGGDVEGDAAQRAGAGARSGGARRGC